MNKTPDEIKKGLYCCAHLCGCLEGCPYEADGSCENGDGVERDALAYIQQLERERDFLLDYLTNTHLAPCDICKHEPESHDINACAHVREVGFPCFEWRGLPEV